MLLLRRTLSIIVTLALSLWLGGLITLFLAVTSLFHTFAAARATAGLAAAGIFHAFERYQLILAAVALLATFGWRLLPARRPAAPRLKTALFALLAVATTAAASSTLLVTPQIDALRERNVTYGAEFSRLHGTSMLLYTGEAAVLLLAGVFLPWTVARDQVGAGAADGATASSGSGPNR